VGRAEPQRVRKGGVRARGGAGRSRLAHAIQDGPRRPRRQWQNLTAAWTSRARARGRPSGARRDGA
jgi:hypothetical protein